MAVVSTLGIGTALCSQAPVPTILAAGQVVTVADESSARSFPGLASRSFPSSGAPTAGLYSSRPSNGLVPLRVVTAGRPALLQLPLARPMPVVAPVLVPLAVTAPAPALLPTQLTAPPRGDQGVLRVAHLSPSTGVVDMYVSGPGLPSTRVASDVGYRAVSGYLTAAPGIYTLAARPAGADPASPPALTANVEVGVRTAQTAAFADVGPGATVQAEVLDDGTQPAAPGKAYVRVVSAAANVGPMNVVAQGGGTIAGGVFYGSSSPYALVDARSWTMDVTTSSGETARTTLPVSSTSVNTVVVTRDPQGALSVTAVPDAAALFAAPAPAAPAPAPAAPAPAAPAPAAPATASPAPAAPPVPASPAPAAPASPAPAAPAPPAPSATTTPAPTTTPAAPTTSAPRPSAPPSSSGTTTRPLPRGGVPAGFGGMAGAPVPLQAGPGPTPAAPGLPTWGAPTSPIRPTGLVVPGAGIEASAVGRLGLDGDGELQAPETPDDIGWYSGSSAPGDSSPAVLVGHVDSYRGPGVFWNLRTLKPGDPIDVPRSDGTVARFALDRVETVDKDAFPTQAVYGPTAGPSLRLITCGGAFDRSVRSYEDNVVVFASPR